MSADDEIPIQEDAPEINMKKLHTKLFTLQAKLDVIKAAIRNPSEQAYHQSMGISFRGEFNACSYLKYLTTENIKIRRSINAIAEKIDQKEEEERETLRLEKAQRKFEQVSQAHLDRCESLMSKQLTATLDGNKLTITSDDPSHN